MIEYIKNKYIFGFLNTLFINNWPRFFFKKKKVKSWILILRMEDLLRRARQLHFGLLLACGISSLELFFLSTNNLRRMRPTLPARWPNQPYHHHPCPAVPSLPDALSISPPLTEDVMLLAPVASTASANHSILLFPLKPTFPSPAPLNRPLPLIINPAVVSTVTTEHSNP